MPVFVIFNCSVVYTSVFKVVVTPYTIKLELIVKSPSINRLLLYLLATMNLFIEVLFSVITSVVRLVILVAIKLLVSRI